MLMVNSKGIHQKNGIVRLHVPYEVEHPDFSFRELCVVPDSGSVAHPAVLASPCAAGSGLVASNAELAQA